MFSKVPVIELNKVIKKLLNSTVAEQVQQIPELPQSYVVKCADAANLIRRTIVSIRVGWDEFEPKRKEKFVSYISKIGGFRRLSGGQSTKSSYFLSFFLSISKIKEKSGIQNPLKKTIGKFFIQFSEKIQRSDDNDIAGDLATTKEEQEEDNSAKKGSVDLEECWAGRYSYEKTGRGDQRAEEEVEENEANNLVRPDIIKIQNGLEFERICLQFNKQNFKTLNTDQTYSCLIGTHDDITFRQKLAQLGSAVLNSDGGYIYVESSSRQSNLIKKILRNGVYPLAFEIDTPERKPKTGQIMMTLVQLKPETKGTVFFVVKKRKINQSATNSVVELQKLVFLNLREGGRLNDLCKCTNPSKFYDIMQASSLLKLKSKKKAKMLIASLKQAKKSEFGIGQPNQSIAALVFNTINSRHFARLQDQRVEAHKNHYLIVFNDFNVEIINQIDAALQARNLSNYQLFKPRLNEWHKQIWYLGFESQEDLIKKIIRQTTGMEVYKNTQVGWLKKCSKVLIVEQANFDIWAHFQRVFENRFGKQLPAIEEKGKTRFDLFQLTFETDQESIFSYIFLQNFFFKVVFEVQRRN